MHRGVPQGPHDLGVLTGFWVRNYATRPWPSRLIQNPSTAAKAFGRPKVRAFARQTTGFSVRANLGPGDGEVRRAKELADGSAGIDELLAGELGQGQRGKGPMIHQQDNDFRPSERIIK